MERARIEQVRIAGNAVKSFEGGSKQEIFFGGCCVKLGCCLELRGSYSESCDVLSHAARDMALNFLIFGLEVPIIKTSVRIEIQRQIPDIGGLLNLGSSSSKPPTIRIGRAWRTLRRSRDSSHVKRSTIKSDNLHRRA